MATRFTTMTTKQFLSRSRSLDFWHSGLNSPFQKFLTSLILSPSFASVHPDTAKPVCEPNFERVTRFPCIWRNVSSILQKKPDWSKKGDEKKVKEEDSAPPIAVEEWENWKSHSRRSWEKRRIHLSVIVNNRSMQELQRNLLHIF